MEKPDLHQMWETFIKIPTQKETIVLNDIYDTIRSKIGPMVSSLRESGAIGWFCFLIHNRHSGVPTSEGDNAPYFHLRFELAKGQDPGSLLPSYCVLTRKVRRRNVESISGLNRALLKNEEVEEAWRIIGEQSEWILRMLDIHKEDVKIPPAQVGQFLHYFANMTCLSVR